MHDAHVFTRMVRLLVTTAAAAVFLFPCAGQTETVEDYFRGKTIRILVGYGEGGTYDLYARLAAEFLPRHLPGSPTIIVQNMPGAGSLKAAQYLNSVASKDGLYLGSLSETLALDVAMHASKIDIRRFSYLGRFSSNIGLGLSLPRSGVKSFADARKRELSIGVTGGTSSAVLIPLALNAYGGSKFRLIRGYRGSADALLAAERGEIDVIGSGGLPSYMASRPAWITKGEATVIFQNALSRHPLLPKVPTVNELVIVEEGKLVLRGIAATAEVGRSIVAPPGVPAERLAALRKAFSAMLVDPKLKAAAAQQRKLMLDTATGEKVDGISEELSALPKSVFARLAGLVKR